MRFEVLVNGVRVCTAGQNDLGVLTALLSWRKVDPAKFVPANETSLPNAWSEGELDFSVGGIDSGDDRHTSWKVPVLAIGDEITIRILAPGPYDPPDAKFG